MNLKYALLLLPLTANATDYLFSNSNHPWHFEADGRAVAGEKFEQHKYRDSRFHYDDATASLYYTQHLSANNFLSYQAGYWYMHVGWDKNPRFREQNYQFGLGSIAFVSTAIERWRWVVKGAVTVDATNFDFGQTGVYYGLLWGRYHHTTDLLGVHIGFFGWIGMKNNYVLPVIGVDYHWTEHWKINLIFPLDFSLEYLFARNWSLELAYTSFGGPYRSPKRAHEGIGRFENGIFEIFSSGAELDLNYKYAPYFTAGIGAGWNFGGWILIKNANNHHGKYYKYDTAPYAQANLGVTF